MQCVTLAHGSGGQETSKLISDIFSKHLSNPYLDRAEDSAVLDLSGGKYAYSTDSFVIQPIEFNGGNIGSLSICGTANDLCMMGAVPKCMTLGVIIEQGMRFDTLERIAKSIGEYASAAGVRIVAADTKVIQGDGGIYLNTSGLGIIPEGRVLSADSLKPGDRVLVSGNLGDHHACILSARMGIENGISSDMALLNKPVAALFDAGITPRAMRDITRGGLATVLNELALASSCGIAVDEESIPADPKTSALCELLGLESVYMGNEGTFALVVPENQAASALEVLRSFRPSACDIGCVTDCGKVYVRTRFGGKRALPPLQGEGLPRIC